MLLRGALLRRGAVVTSAGPIAGWMLAAITALMATPPPAEPSPPAKGPRFTCPDALADGTLVDPHQGDVLAALASGLKAARSTGGAGDPFGRPSDCHRQVRLFCGPDLDGDGDREAIVEVSWWFTEGCAAESREDEAPIATTTFLASKHGTSWRGVATLGAGLSEGPSSRRAYFVRRRRGETAIRVEWSNVVSDSGCALGGYEIFTLRAGSLRRLEAGDSSRICAPCGCH
jgi:hypothetical protein